MLFQDGVFLTFHSAWYISAGDYIRETAQVLDAHHGTAETEGSGEEQNDAKDAQFLFPSRYIPDPYDRVTLNSHRKTPNKTTHLPSIRTQHLADIPMLSVEKRWARIKRYVIIWVGGIPILESKLPILVFWVECIIWAQIKKKDSNAPESQLPLTLPGELDTVTDHFLNATTTSMAT